jgi:hypothetical protein
MPAATLTALQVRLHERGFEEAATNVNGKPLYRPLQNFGEDMKRIADGLTLAL